MTDAWPKYLLGASVCLFAMLIGYQVIDQTGAGEYVQEDANVTNTGHAEAWTQHTDLHIPGDHGMDIIVPQTIDWPESWTFAIETRRGVVERNVTQPEAGRLLGRSWVSIRYRVGRLSGMPFDLSF